LSSSAELFVILTLNVVKGKDLFLPHQQHEKVNHKPQNVIIFINKKRAIEARFSSVNFGLS
jgi:hypothetical protein